MPALRPFLIAALVVLARPAVAAPLPSIADKTVTMQKQDGLFPIYWDAQAGVLYLEVPRLDTEVLYQIGVAAGMGSNDIGIDRGALVDTRIVSFQRVGPKVLLVESNWAYRATSRDPAERRAVDDAFARSVLCGFTVVAETDGRVLIDASDLLLRDVTGAAQQLKPAAYHFDASRSAIYLPNTKAFPRNTELEVTTTLTTDSVGPGPGDTDGHIADVTPNPEAITIRAHHSLVQLPDGNFTPRRHDPRAGYFNDSYLDFSAPFGSDPRVRFIERHRLIKKHPGAALSEPVEPIVYYVDRGAPEPIRAALLEGASWWSSAFEAAGFKNAFRVELLPEGADPMDVRYNVINWVHRSTRGWSWGNSIVDPRTGEVIKGQVLLGSLRAQEDYLIGEGLTAPYAAGNEHPKELTDLVVARLRQLAAHEVGHTLGLAHNYYDSTRGRISVMDYPQPLIDRLLKATFGARTASPYEAEIERAIQRVLVDRLIVLAFDAQLPEVRAIATLELVNLERTLKRTAGGPTVEVAHRALLAGDIRRYLDHPGDPRARPPAPPKEPPGAPIGD